MHTTNDIYRFLSAIAPPEKQMDFDNSGFLIGRLESKVSKIIVSLDLTSNVVEEALSEKANVIVTHHPVIFKPLKSLTDKDYNTKNLLTLAEHGISVISMHTNLDISEGGVNDCLADLFDCTDREVLDVSGLGRTGILAKPMLFEDFLELCKCKLNTNGIRFVSCSKIVNKIAFLGGAGADYIHLAIAKGCDTFLTSDIKYHEFLDAAELGINLIDADHFCTEDPVIFRLCEILSSNFPDIHVIKSSTHKQTVQFY